MNDYSDIINHPHYEPKNHPRMPRLSRAAQFAPFAALTGYEEVIEKKQEIGDERVILEDEAKNELDRKLGEIIKASSKLLTITYYDEGNGKGRYRTITGNILRVDKMTEEIIMADGKRIALIDILSIN